MAQPASVHLWSIDPHGPHLDGWPDSYPKLLSNLKRYGVADKVTALKATSEQATIQIDPAFDLLFIDGDHTYAGTREHADSWATRLQRGGILAMHDVVNPNFEGPMRVYLELLRQGWRGMGIVRSIGVIMKP